MDATDLDASSSDEPEDASTFPDSPTNRDAGDQDAALAMPDAHRDAMGRGDASDAEASPYDAGVVDAPDAGPSCPLPTKSIVAQYGASPTLLGVGFPEACACTPTCACLLEQSVCELASYASPKVPTSCNDQGTGWVLLCPPPP